MGLLGSAFKLTRSIADDVARLVPRGVKPLARVLVTYDVVAPVAEQVTGRDLPGGGVILGPLVRGVSTAVGDSVGTAQANLATSYTESFLRELGISTDESVGGVKVGSLITLGILGLAAFALLQVVKR